MVMVTAGSTAPLSSCTVPTIAPVFACPKAAVSRHSTRNTLAAQVIARRPFGLIVPAFLPNLRRAPGTAQVAETATLDTVIRAADYSARPRRCLARWARLGSD